MKRAAVFIDGFNLYHGLKAAADNHLKWCNLWQLSEDIIPSKSQELVEVHFSTAFVPNDNEKTIRHRAYNRALTLVRVKIHEGTFVNDRRRCPSCAHEWKIWAEKQSDINIALALMDAAYRDVFDHCYLMTTDSDHAATVTWLRAKFPGKELTIVVPPNKERSKLIEAWAGGAIIRLERANIERALFDEVVTGEGGSIKRPRAYAPPN